MNQDRYKQLFKKLKSDGHHTFCPFAVLGHPNFDESFNRLKIYVDNGADVLEIGFPFSDPIADGPIIQAADTQALNNGITTKKCFALIKKIRNYIQQNSSKNIPIGVLVYTNTVLQFGIENFYKELQSSGADSILIADLPIEEIQPFTRAARAHALKQIIIVSELTTVPRLHQIKKHAGGFLYLVSTLGVTGERSRLQNLQKITQKIKRVISLPILIGFGISKPQHIMELKKSSAEGMIVGSALVKIPTKDLANNVQIFSKACHD